MVSKARLDLPDPERPVTTMSLSRGISTEMFLRLWTRTPWTAMVVRALWDRPPGLSLLISLLTERTRPAPLSCILDQPRLHRILFNIPYDFTELGRTPRPVIVRF